MNLFKDRVKALPCDILRYFIVHLSSVFSGFWERLLVRRVRWCCTTQNMFGSGASKQKLQQITTALYELRWRRRHWSMNSTHPFSPFKKSTVISQLFTQLQETLVWWKKKLSCGIKARLKTTSTVSSSLLSRVVSEMLTIFCSYLAIHTFGRRMIYPGATCIQVLMGTYFPFANLTQVWVHIFSLGCLVQFVPVWRHEESTKWDVLPISPWICFCHQIASRHSSLYLERKASLCSYFFMSCQNTSLSPGNSFSLSTSQGDKLGVLERLLS